jgi:hypothetical protein
MARLRCVVNPGSNYKPASVAENVECLREFSKDGEEMLNRNQQNP